MNTLRERVSLPDPADQPFVHPLDLPDGRRAFRQAQLVAIVGSPGVLVLLGAVVWVLAGGLLAPAAAVVSTGVLAELARRHLLDAAWALIPRWRQDHGRPEAWRWAVARTVTGSLALVGGVVVVLGALATQGYDVGVLSYSLGAAAGLGLAMLAAAGGAVWSRRDRYAALELAAATVSLAAGAVVVAAAGWLPSRPDWPTALLGMAVLLAVYALAIWSTRPKGPLAASPATPSA